MILLSLLFWLVSWNAHGTSKCCLCFLPYENDHRVSPFIAPDCSSQNGVLGQTKCRAVETLESSCTFVTVTRSGGGLQCKKNPFRILEKGVVSTIPVPKGPLGPCDFGLIVKKSELDAAEDKEKDKNGGDSELPYWSCGRSNLHQDKCTAKLFSEGKVIHESTKEIGRGHACDAETCSNLFEGQFSGQASRYVQGDY